MRSLVRCILFALLTTSCLFDWTVVPKKGSDSCQSNDDCAETSYCKWADSSCGRGDAIGTCTTRPKSCSDDASQVCGCHTASNITASPCLFALKGVDVNETCK